MTCFLLEPAHYDQQAWFDLVTPGRPGSDAREANENFYQQPVSFPRRSLLHRSYNLLDIIDIHLCGLSERRQAPYRAIEMGMLRVLSFTLCGSTQSFHWDGHGWKSAPYNIIPFFIKIPFPKLNAGLFELSISVTWDLYHVDTTYTTMSLRK